MIMQATSLQAYEEVKKTLGKKQAAVLDMIEHNPYPITNTEIAVHFNLPINTITPRVFELREKGLVREDHKRKCHITGRMAIAWRVRRPDEIEHQGEFDI